MDALGRQCRAPSPQHVGKVLDLPEPGGRVLAAQDGDEVVEALLRPVLHVLLPLRGDRRTRSRAVSTTCTSTDGPNAAMARSACAAVAGAKSSWEMSTSPSHDSDSRDPAPHAGGPLHVLGLRVDVTHLERGEVVVEDVSSGQEQTLLPARSRCDQRTACRNVVPVLGLPTWRKTRRAMSGGRRPAQPAGGRTRLAGVLLDRGPPR